MNITISMDKRKRVQWAQDDKKLLRSTSRQLSRTPSLADILKDTYAHSKLKVYFSNIVGLRLADVPDQAEVSLSFGTFLTLKTKKKFVATE